MKLKNETYRHLLYEINEHIVILQTIADHAHKLYSITTSPNLTAKQKEVLDLLIEKYELKDGDDFMKMMKHGYETEVYILNRFDNILRIKIEDAPEFLIEEFHKRKADGIDEADDVNWKEFLEEYAGDEYGEFLRRWLPIKEYKLPDSSLN
jgi:hypothetical protein